MPIVSSAFALGVPQVSGLRYVTVTHTLSDGGVIVGEFGPTSVVDCQPIVDAQAANINERLAEDEANALLGD